MLQPILFYSSDTKNILKDSDPDSKTLSKEEKKMDEYVLVTHESIKVKVGDGYRNGQKELMQQVNQRPPLSCLKRW
jgi:hypothetical protein